MNEESTMKNWMDKITIFLLLVSLAGGVFAGEKTFIYPVPRNISYGAGTAVVSNGNFNAPAALSSVVTDKVKDIFSAYAGITLIDGTVVPQVKFTQNAALHDQGYSLDISAAGGVEVSYKDDAGAFHAAATLKQLLFQNGANLPYLTITDDYPDFPNRGFMWDISRNKIPTVATIKRVIDIMADLKLNQLQLYIEGYPFAYASYPDVWAGGTPLTPADFKEIDAYCAERFIEFVPNQNSYGHMYKWLALPQFDGIKEVPGKANASTVALTNPETITFLKNLYGDLLPNFTSQYFNIGGDETYEVGTGQSKDAYPDLSKEEIYLEGLKRLYGLVNEEGKRMMFWADMIVKYVESNPEIVEATRAALPNAIPINWGYSETYDFEKSTTQLKNAGFKYYVSPGTATWSSIIGRTSNMTKNLENAAHWGKKNGAIGYLLTTWGDQGHKQQLICDYPPLVYAAGLSWNGEQNQKEQVDYNQYVSRFIFQDTAEDLSKELSDLADYRALGSSCWNKTWINYVGTEPYSSTEALELFIKHQKGGGTDEEKKKKALMQAEQTAMMAQSFLDYLPTVTMKADDKEIIRAELENSAYMLKDTAEYVAMRLRIYNGVSTPDQEAGKAAELYHEYKLALTEFKTIWMMRNKLSLRDEAMGKLYNPLKYFKHIAGNPYQPLADGNHVLLTPDMLSIPLTSDEFASGWVWSLSGSGEPVVTSVYGVDNATQIKGAIAEGVISILDDETGVFGGVFCFDPVVALQKGYYKIWEGDGKTKLLPRFGWPLLVEGNGDYEITFKAKFKNGTKVQGNLSLLMTAAKPVGGLKGFSPASIIYSKPDSYDWVTITLKYAISDVQTASFYIVTPPTATDSLYIVELFMSRVDQ